MRRRKKHWAGWENWKIIAKIRLQYYGIFISENGKEEETERKIYNSPASHSENCTWSNQVTADSLQIDIVFVPHVI